MLNRYIAAALLATLPLMASAGSARESAEGHFEAISRGQIETLMSAYAPGATLQWVGGPLDGVYSDVGQLREVWTRFTKAQGPLDVAVNNVRESANPKGASVTANVEFHGKNSIKVRYLLTYRDGKIVNEVWQIDPNLGDSNVSGY